jgi:hypothetical protein
MRPSVNDLVSRVDDLQVGNIQRFDRFQGQKQRFVRAPTIQVPQVLPQLAQRAQHLRSIEPLALTMLTKVHHPLRIQELVPGVL